MSFKMIERENNSRSLAVGVAVGAVKTTQDVKFRLRFAPDILDAMNWQPGCRLGLAFGEGSDDGKLRIGSDKLNGFKLQNGARHDRSKYMQCGRIGDQHLHKRESAPHEIRDGYLYIDLPDWARSSGE